MLVWAFVCTHPFSRNPHTVLKGNLGADGRSVLTGLLIVKYRPAELLAELKPLESHSAVLVLNIAQISRLVLYSQPPSPSYSSVKGKTNFLLPHTLNRH